jgi:hypothetical protein
MDLPPHHRSPTQEEVTVPDRLEELEAQVRSLTGALDELRGRVGTLEARGAATPAPARRRTAAVEPTVALGAAVQASDATVGATAPLVGRMLLILAGAFVLRALTDAGTLPATVGVTLGFAYAGAVHALAARVASPLAAAFHGLTAVLIGFPLILEATARFHLLGPVLSALLLVALGGSVLAVAAWRRLPAVAWLGTIGVVLTAIGLMVATGRLVPATLALVALGLATAWLGYLIDWHGLRWPVAAVADLAFVVVAARAVAPASAEGPGLALAAGGLLVVAYLGSFAARTLYLGRSVVAFEVAQTAGVVLAGLGGAAWVTARSGAGTGALGVGTLAVAAACYGVAFAFVGRRQRGSANFYFYTTVALAFALAGTWLALPGAARGAALGLLTVTCAALARAQERRTLVVHAALFALSAAGAAGLLGHADLALFSSAAVPWPALPVEALGVLACLAAAALVSARANGRSTLLTRAPQLALDLAVALPAAGVLAGWAALALGPPGPDADLGLVGTARTAVLASGAVLAAWLGRREAGREAGWLAWPLVAVLGLKLLLEDLPRGRPATLILSFAFTGAALILVPRLRARAPAAATSPARA